MVVTLELKFKWGRVVVKAAVGRRERGLVRRRVQLWQLGGFAELPMSNAATGLDSAAAAERPAAAAVRLASRDRGRAGARVPRAGHVRGRRLGAVTVNGLSSGRARQCRCGSVGDTAAQVAHCHAARPNDRRNSPGIRPSMDGELRYGAK